MIASHSGLNCHFHLGFREVFCIFKFKKGPLKQKLEEISDSLAKKSIDFDKRLFFYSIFKLSNFKYFSMCIFYYSKNDQIAQNSNLLILRTIKMEKQLAGVKYWLFWVHRMLGIQFQVILVLIIKFWRVGRQFYTPPGGKK